MAPVLAFLLFLAAQSAATQAAELCSFDAISCLNCTSSESRAARFLQKSAFDGFGCLLPITNKSGKVENCLVVGKVGASTLGLSVAGAPPETLGLHSSGSCVAIAGSDLRGTWYAVARLLRDSSCQFTPALMCAGTGLLPHYEKLLHTPSFPYRDTDALSVHTSGYQVSAGYNGFWSAAPPSEGGSRGFIPGYWAATFRNLAPARLYFDNHPEWYPLIGGVRVASNVAGPTQLCLTNQSLLEHSISTVRAVLDQFQPNSSLEFFSISQQDQMSGWCQCSFCKAAVARQNGSQIGPVIEFVNAIASNMSSQFPNITFTTLAYEHTVAPPLTPPAKNVQVRFAPLLADYAHPLDAAQNQKYRDALFGWSRLMRSSENVGSWGLWTYTTAFHSYQTPFPNLRTLQQNILLAHSLGMKSFFSEANRQTPAALEDLRMFMTSRFLDDVSLAVGDAWRALTEEWTGLVLQHHAALANQYIFALHDQLYAFNGSLTGTTTFDAPFLTPAFVLHWADALHVSTFNTSSDRARQLLWVQPALTVVVRWEEMCDFAVRERVPWPSALSGFSTYATEYLISVLEILEITQLNESGSMNYSWLRSTVPQELVCLGV